MRTFTPVAVLVGLLSNVSSIQADSAASFHPPAGFVPTGDVAIAIAVAVWAPIYGADLIAKEKPYHAVLRDGVWLVSGSLPSGAVGGVVRARIKQSNGEILGVVHGQ